MTPAEFRSVCEEFDWSYLMSDDPAEFRRGRQGEDRLIALADTAEKLAMLAEFKRKAYPL